MSTKQLSQSRLSQSEQGMISLMTTMVLIIIISLIVLGFAQLSRRNQRESIDRQLSTQAFYAAESGVNDARDTINAAVTAGTVVPEKTTCTGSSGGFYTKDPNIDTATNVKYSCLLVDPSPTVLRYTDIGTNAVVVPINAATGSIAKIQMNWQSKITGNPMTGCSASIPTLPTASGWTCGYGVLRFDLVPTAGNLTASGLANATMTTFAIPISGGTNSIAYAAGSANNNVQAGVKCTSTDCNLTVTGLSSAGYYMRISSQYRNVSLQIKSYNSVGGAIEMSGAQALIDSTGRAQDVLRRIQVSVPLQSDSQNQVSDYAVQSTDSICKRFSVMDGFYSNSASGVTSSNRLCIP